MILVGMQNIRPVDSSALVLGLIGGFERETAISLVA